MAKLATATDEPPRGGTGLLPALLMKSKLENLQLSVLSLLPKKAAMPFRRGKVIDVQYLAPSWFAVDQSKPVILLRLSLARDGEMDKEDKVTKLPGCSFRFRGIDKKGIMFEREYTAVRIAKQKSRLRQSKQEQHMSLAGMESTPARSTRFLSRRISIGDDDEECYDFVITLVPGGQMSNFILGLKRGQLLLAQGPKVSPPVVNMFSKPTWNSVVFFAGGSGIAPMLQVIDFYLEKEHRDEIPFLFLVWVVKSPAHGFHETLGITHRIRASGGRLKLLTIFSSFGDDSSSNTSDPKRGPLDRGSTKSSNSSRIGRGDWTRKTAWMRASREPGRKLWMRASHQENGLSRVEERPHTSGARGSQQEYPQTSSATPRAVGPFAAFLGGDRRPKVRDLVARAKTSNENSGTLATTDESGLEHVFDGDFWIQPVRSMNRPFAQPLIDGLLTSAHEYAAKLSPKFPSVPEMISEHLNEKASSESDVPTEADDKVTAATKSKQKGVNELDADATTRTAAESDEEEADAAYKPPPGAVIKHSNTAFDGMLVALSGSPKLEYKLSLKLDNIGLPKKQVITFGIGTAHV